MVQEDDLGLVDGIGLQIMHRKQCELGGLK